MPRLLTPSVRSTITRDAPGASLSRLAAVAIAVPIAVPSSSCPGCRLLIACVHDRVVGGQRHLRQRLAGEGDDADAIAPAHGDELLHLVARHLEPVLRLKVLGQHRARDVEGDDDVDALRADVLGARPRAGPRERGHGAEQHEVAQQEE